MSNIEENKEPQAEPKPAPKIALLAVYYPGITESTLFKNLQQLGEENFKKLNTPYTISNFELLPLSSNPDHLTFQIHQNSKFPFGVFCRLYEINLESLKNQNSTLYDLFLRLKEAGELGDLPNEEDYLYLYRVGNFSDDIPLFAPSKLNVAFKDNLTKEFPNKDVSETKRNELLNSIYTYYEGEFGKESALAVMNHLAYNFEKSFGTSQEIILSFLDNVKRGNDGFTYEYKKGSLEKIMIDVDIKPFVGDQIFMIPALKEKTGNFDHQDLHKMPRRNYDSHNNEKSESSSNKVSVACGD